MIAAQAKDFMETVIRNLPNFINGSSILFAKSKTEENRLISDRVFPFVSLLTDSGVIDSTSGGEFQWEENIPSSLSQKEFDDLSERLDETEKGVVIAGYRFDSSCESYRSVDLTLSEEMELGRIMGRLGFGKRYRSYIKVVVKQPIEIRIFAGTERESNQILSQIITCFPEKWSLGNYQGEIVLERCGESDRDLNDYLMSYCVALFCMPIGTEKEEVPMIQNFAFADAYEHLK